MKFIEVCLTVTIGGQPLTVRVMRSPDNFYIITGESRTHRVDVTPKCWKTDSRVIVLYIDDIRKAYLDTLAKFKWHLPKKLKDVVNTAKIDTDNRMVTFWLDYIAKAPVFEELLSRHLINHQIKPWLPVRIYDQYSDKYIDLNLHLKNAKGHFPIGKPIMAEEFKQLVVKPEDPKK